MTIDKPKSNKYHSALFSVRMLPTEIILRILNYLNYEAFPDIYFVSKEFAKACQLIPSIQAKEIIQRLYHGDFSGMSGSYFTDRGECIILSFLSMAYRSEKFASFRAKHSYDRRLCGRYCILIAVSLGLSIDQTHDSPDFDDKVRLIQSELHSRHEPSHHQCLAHASADIFDLITPDTNDLQRLHLSILHGSVDATRTYFERQEKTQIFFQRIVEDTYKKLARNKRRIIEILFAAQDKSLMRTYVSHYMYSRSDSIHATLFDAFFNNHVPLDDWMQLLIYWLFTSDSLVLLNKIIPYTNLQDKNWSLFAIYCTIIHGAPASVIAVLNDPRVDISAHLDFIWNEIEDDNLIILFEKLVQNERTVPYFRTCRALRFSIENELTWATKLLMKDGYHQIDPTEDDYILIKTVIESYQYDLLSVFLKHPRVDPAANDNELVKFAAKFGTFECLEMLLQDPRVNPAAEDNEAIKGAAEEGRIAHVKLLMDQPSVDPSANDNEALIRNMSNLDSADVEMVKILLTDPRVDPAARNNEPIKLAAEYGLHNIVLLLMSFPSVDPGANDSEPLRKYIRHRRYKKKLAALLIIDPRVDPSALNNDVLRCLFSRINRNGILERDLTVAKDGFVTFHPPAKPDELYLDSLESNLVILLLKDERVRQKFFASQSQWRKDNLST